MFLQHLTVSCFVQRPPKIYKWQKFTVLLCCVSKNDRQRVIVTSLTVHMTLMLGMELTVEVKSNSVVKACLAKTTHSI